MNRKEKLEVLENFMMSASKRWVPVVTKELIENLFDKVMRLESGTARDEIEGLLDKYLDDIVYNENEKRLGRAKKVTVDLYIVFKDGGVKLISSYFLPDDLENLIQAIVRNSNDIKDDFHYEICCQSKSTRRPHFLDIPKNDGLCRSKILYKIQEFNIEISNREREVEENEGHEKQ